MFDYGQQKKIPGSQQIETNALKVAPQQSFRNKKKEMIQV
jgi:hypothetical protein